VFATVRGAVASANSLLSSATSLPAVSIKICAFMAVMGGSPNIFSQRLAPLAADGRETAISNHLSSNRPVWLSASKPRRTTCANLDVRVSSKDDERLYS
jgi:hypothetical protein